MVRFFNQKEEVLNIELTPYGRQQFSSGSFAPAFYAFYDSSIIYDGEFAGITETQNQITNRISNETPKLYPNARFTSTPGSIYSLASAQTNAEFLQNNSWVSSYNRTLGSSDPNSVYAPSWDIKVTEFGDVGLNSGIEYITDQTIPQMSATLIIDYESEELSRTGNTLITLLSSQTLILDVEELNTVFKSNGNFDIEVLISGSDGQRTPLGFINNDSARSVELLSQLNPSVLSSRMNTSENEISRTYPILNDSYAEFFLDISVDREISNLIMQNNSNLYKSQINRDPRELCDDDTDI
jgi:hypothetical protein